MRKILLLTMLLVGIKMAAQVQYMKVYLKDGNKQEFAITDVEYVGFGEKDLECQMLYGDNLYDIRSVNVENKEGKYEISLYSQSDKESSVPDILITMDESQIGSSVDLENDKTVKVFLNGSELSDISGSLLISEDTGVVTISLKALDGTTLQKVQAEYSGSYTSNSKYQEQVGKIKQFLTGEIVLSTKFTMSDVDKTCLENGCPAKYSFTWDEKTDSVTFSMLDTPVGIITSFQCKLRMLDLNNWEKQEFTGDGWIKFYGENGIISMDENKEGSVCSGSFVQGYYNANTHQIELITNYNMMNIRSEIFLQVIDKDRINNYDDEKAQYKKDLEAYKKEHGIG